VEVRVDGVSRGSWEVEWPDQAQVRAKTLGYTERVVHLYATDRLDCTQVVRDAEQGVPRRDLIDGIESMQTLRTCRARSRRPSAAGRASLSSMKDAVSKRERSASLISR